MIAVGANDEDSHQNVHSAAIPGYSLGGELPSQSCNLSDLDIPTNDIVEQLLLQSFAEHPHMPLETSTSNFQPSQCNLTTLLLEDTPRPRDLNLSFPEENNHHGPVFKVLEAPQIAALSVVSQLFDGGSSSVDALPGAIFNTSTTQVDHLSRASSPAWSESSGSTSAGATTPAASSSMTQGRQGLRDGSSIPRHKRPSHKRAEIKRRDKIKTCLDDIKSSIPSIAEKGKLSESSILTKAAEYIHHLKDGCSERGSTAAQLRREIECLSLEIHSFQENLPAAGLREDNVPSMSLDNLHQRWISENTQKSNKFIIFNSLTSQLFASFNKVVGPATTLESLNACAQEWQDKHLALPVLRKQIVSGMLELTRTSSIVADTKSLRLDIGDKHS